MDELQYTFPDEVPRVGVDGKHVVLQINGTELMFPYDVWDATVRYLKDLRAGKTTPSNGFFIQTLPKHIAWEDTLPNV